MENSRSKEIFAEWLAMPKKMREPKTQKELAAELDVGSVTLSRWKNDVDFQELVHQRTLSHLMAELPEVMHVIIDKAKEGDFRFAKMVLELTGRYSERITVRQEVTEIGIEQYSAAIKKFEDWKRGRFGE